MAKKVKLENYIHIQNGYAFKSNLFQNFGVPVVRITNVENGKLNLDKVVYYSEDKKLDKFFIKNNDILLSLTGDDKTLKVCINESDEKLYLNQRVAILRSNESLVQKYLYYSIKKYSLLILEKAKGIAQKNISVDDINSLEIPLPDLDEQKQIAKTLDKAQELIDLRKESIAKLDELAKSIFIDMFGNPVSNPKGWNIEKLENLVEKEKNSLKTGPFGSSLKKEFYVQKGYKIYGQEQVIADDFEYGDYYIDEKRFLTLKNYAIKTNDVLISLVGSFGKIAIVPEVFQEGIINPRLMKISFNCKVYNPVFFKYLFYSDSFKQQVQNHSHGGTMGILNLTILKNLNYINPKIELQNKFAKTIEKIEEQKSLYKQELEKLEENFQALLQQSFGE